MSEKITIEGTNLVLKAPLVGPVWWSKYIDEHNDNYNEKTGKMEERGKPGFNIGSEYEPSVGIGTDSCRKGIICRPLFSDQGWLKYLNNYLPGFSDFSAFHDNHMGKVEGAVGETTSIPVKVISIPVYLGLYYYGAIGTNLNKINNYIMPSNGNKNSVVIKK